MNELEISLQQFINRSFENIGSIEQSLHLLKNYQAILHRGIIYTPPLSDSSSQLLSFTIHVCADKLRSDLESKLTIIFNNYGDELAQIEQIYEAYKHNPPIPRNLPPGNPTSF